MISSGMRSRRIQALLGVGFLLSPLSALAEEPYNVLLIIADDLNSRIAPLGDPQAVTPHLTRLAQRSVTYRNCVSQYPFCAPSRGSFLTGLHPWHLGIHAAGGNQANGENIVPGRMRMSQFAGTPPAGGGAGGTTAAGGPPPPAGGPGGAPPP